MGKSPGKVKNMKIARVIKCGCGQMATNKIRYINDKTHTTDLLLKQESQYSCCKRIKNEKKNDIKNLW